MRESFPQITKEVWNTSMKEAEDLVFGIYSAYMRLADNKIIPGSRSSFITSFIPEISKKLKKLTGIQDLEEYAIYHEFIGSTTDFENTPKLDLPNGEIFSYLKSLLQKLELAEVIGKLEF